MCFVVYSGIICSDFHRLTGHHGPKGLWEGLPGGVATDHMTPSEGGNGAECGGLDTLGIYSVMNNT